MRWGTVARIVFTVAFLVSGLFISNNSLKPDNAIAQTSPITVYSCDELLSKLQQVANGTAVIAAVDNCTVVNNKIRAVVRMNQETCVIFNNLPYCQGSPNDAWIDTVQSNNRALIRDLIRTGEYYAHKCGVGINYDPFNEVNWICRSDRAINGNTQTITTRTWLTISPRPTTTITADKTSVTIGHPTFMLSWQAQFADNIRLQKSSDGTSWQEYQGYGYNLTPPTSGNQTITAQGSYSSIVHQYFRTVSTNVYNQQGFGQNDWAGYSNTLDITVSPIEVTLTADPTTITAGNSSTLSWTSEGADTLAIDNGVGAVTPLELGSKLVSPTQTTTYTITARAQNGVTATASAKVTVGLPDLIVDLSQAKSKVDGSVKDKALVSADTTEFKITGIRVSNIGDATAPAGFVLDVGLGEYVIETTLPEIASNQTIEVSEVNLLDLWRALQLLGALQTLLKSGTNTVDLNVEVNPDPKPLTEKNFNNNRATSAQFFSWPAARIEVEIAESHTLAKEAVVSISLNGKSQDGLTDDSGTAYFAPLAKPGVDINYTVTVTFEGEKDIGKGSIEVRDYVIYDQTIVINPKDGLVIDPYLLQPDEDKSKPSDFVGFEAKGAVTGNVTVAVVGSGGKLLTQDLVWGKAKFSELKSGEKVLVKSITAVAAFDVYSRLRNQKVTYRWSEKANGPLELDYQGDRQVEIVEIKLITNCEAKTTNGKIKICIYDDEEAQATAQKTWLPVVTKTLNRMTNFQPSTALTVTQEVWAMTRVAGGGHFDLEAPEYLFFSTRIAATDNLIAADIVMHEAMHAIDFQNGIAGLFSGQDTSYTKSVALTSEGDAPASLSPETGKWAWKNVGWFCGVAPARVKDMCGGHDDPSDGPAEVWAEQMTTLCLLPAELKGKIANFEGVYRANPMKDPNGNVLPPPVDLADHVSILASRSVGDNVFAPGRGYVIWGANGYNTMVLNVLRMANSCDPAVEGAKAP